MVDVELSKKEFQRLFSSSSEVLTLLSLTFLFTSSFLSARSQCNWFISKMPERYLRMSRKRFFQL